MSNPVVLAKYNQLSQKGKIIAEYIWIDGSNNLRCKAKTLSKPVTAVSDLSWWNFDGSSTGQAPGHDSDVLLKPVSYYPDPFRGGDNILVMCECWNPDGTPNKFNHRHAADLLLKAHAGEKIWFGLEQEYTLLDKYDNIYGWPKGGYPAPQGPYYCAVGTGNVIARDVIEAHYKACLFAGINISGINAEVMPSQWEFQVGPCEGIEMGDQLWVARFLLDRVAEEFDVKITYHPKPLKGDWNGAGCHTNVSTEKMRVKGGMKYIEEAISKLAAKHDNHILLYGKDNDLRLTGRHETASISNFSSGVANRGSSIRIPRPVAIDGYGYFEDRRPASNIDPYLVTGIVTETICGSIPEVDMVEEFKRESK
ncbi:glutamate--ammonia ligase [Ascoidea rubescens DSM 1968]|uniref:Glutamine synthetase n=1 Tax=Ascoidea rubescens DSM 1968 TaxID=1344418 RepID=A0A1D2VH93_9ASCO|nr:glutamine synthetase, synthesizes glutamine from glutamate and ammonia [Ascoidea rubescens DSM 1968]ODV60969.1 glutamine synthetase, synthesizes glutamine from glutamate and ammonia [Ascoidea rubescens DSM 1968]